MLTLVLTRHGLTDRSIPSSTSGSGSTSRSTRPAGRQARRWPTGCRAVTFDRVITSPLFRARETAGIIVPRRGHRGRPAAQGDGLRRVGRADLRPARGAGRRDAPGVGARPGPRWPARAASPATTSPSASRSFLSDLIDEHRAWYARASFRAATRPGGPGRGPGDRPVLAVGHSSTNRILLCVALGTESATTAGGSSRARATSPCSAGRTATGPRTRSSSSPTTSATSAARTRFPGSRPAACASVSAGSAAASTAGVGRLLGHAGHPEAATTAATGTADTTIAAMSRSNGLSASRMSTPVRAEDRARVGERDGPRQRAERREQDELADRHPGDARRERDERPDDRQQPAEEHRRGAVLAKKWSAGLDLVVADQQVAAVALEERPAAPGADGVRDERADGCCRSSPR